MIFKGISDLIKHFSETDKLLYESLRRINEGLDTLYKNVTDLIEAKTVNPLCIITNSGNQATVTGVPLTLTWNVNYVDTDAMHHVLVDPSRIVIRTPGYYLFGATVRWATNAVGYRDIFIRMNNGVGGIFLGEDIQTAVGGGIDTICNINPLSVTKLVTGDFLELLVNQNSGGGLNVLNFGTISPIFYAVKVG